MGVNAAWSLYRQCAATAAHHKSRMQLLTQVSLALGVAGAVIASIGQVYYSGSKVLGVAGSLAVALAGVTATQATSDDRAKRWLKCRSAGESLKSSVYLNAMSVKTVDQAELDQRVEKALKDLEGTELYPAKGDTKPPGPLSVDDYMKVRLDDQINFYTKRAGEYRGKSEFWKFFSFGAATVSAGLGAVSAIYSVTPWVGLLATTTASMTAYVKNQRYASLISTYQATAIRLQLLKDQWLDGSKSDPDSFVERCEQTMALENGAWNSQWSQGQ